ncbi:hypothetical protein QJS10_CPA07g00580 [Acorus calamus]|uniref:Reverse transcriptase domain-containing protein n=1 Tax=Acorus calamus TaxID=4465 RepID=A0AAV9EHF5_ACOCL|nr:hypothetical protein QJS10_CPA07g00580 [Acorus calamus]
MDATMCHKDQDGNAYYWHAYSGLRQGDPLSPYLFTLVAEVISSLFRRQQRLGRLTGYAPHPSIEGLTHSAITTHVLYADDLVVVTIAVLMQCVEIRNVLQEAYWLTGLEVSWTKSSVHFSPTVPPRFKRWMCRILHIRTANSSWRYLGIQIFGKLSGKQKIEEIEGKISAKMQLWRV